MKAAVALSAVAAGVIALAALAYTGYVRSYLDEETQITFFVKTYPTLQVEFFDPFANEGNDIGISDLSVEHRKMFADYCKYRFGIAKDDTASLNNCKHKIPPYL